MIQVRNLFGVFTPNRDKAEELIRNIIRTKGKSNVAKEYNTRFNLRVIFKDGTELRWIDPTVSSIGCRVRGAWVDREVSDKIYNAMIAPCLLDQKMVNKF